MNKAWKRAKNVLLAIDEAFRSFFGLSSLRDLDRRVAEAKRERERSTAAAEAARLHAIEPAARRLRENQYAHIIRDSLGIGYGQGDEK